MTIENFYIISSRLSSSTVQVHAISLSGRQDKHGLFDQHKLVLGEYNGIAFPVIFRQEYGKKWEDIIDTGWVGLFLISERFKKVLEENSLTGWKIFAVKVFEKNGREVQGYYGFSIIGRCGAIDYRKSEVLEKRFVSSGPLAKFCKGLHIGLEHWDGEDFFLPERYYGTIITSRVANLLKKNKISNIRIDNLADVETHIGSWQGA